MRMFGNRFFRPGQQLFPRLAIAPLVIAGWVATIAPNSPAIAATARRSSHYTYELCARRLAQVSGLDRDQIALACAKALRPRRLSRCVLKIKQGTSRLSGPEILDACKRVRRPRQLRKCVLRIDAHVAGTVEPEILDYCRRSLLPLEFSKCVIGLNRQAPVSAIPPTELMETCITANDYPRELDPTFIPN